MSVLAIKGHATRGKEVIEILEMLGGVINGKLLGTEAFCAYYIDSDSSIDYKHYSRFDDAIQFTLEEFLKKFPYKFGDRVRVPEYESEVCISKMYWDGNEVQYEVVTDEVEWYSAKELNEFNEPNKEETAEDIIKIDIPKGYEFAGVDDDKQQVVFEKIDCQYPKTYEECCKVLGLNNAEIKIKILIHNIEHGEAELYRKFIELKRCRNAYWKIAGEQMSLGKPWEPDFTNDDEERYGIYTAANKVVKDFCGVGDVNVILTFPTEEMRDAFLENFKELIELCKKLL